MNSFKARFLVLGVSVVALGIVLGTTLWLKLDRYPRFGGQVHGPLEELAPYGSVPNFSLVERSGKTVNLATLRGTIWVADFIYTSCKDTCPLQTAEMVKLQGRLKGASGVRLVSFSVDPEKDTPEVLSRYADRFGADATRWWFLTGSKSQLTRLVQEGFRLSAVSAPSGGAEESNVILHSPRFVLVDKQARIRGYYDSRDAKALQRLEKDIADFLER